MEPNESLQIIENMIAKTKGNIATKSKYFLLWGWAVFLTAIAQYILIRMLFPHAQMVWLSMIIAGIIAVFIAVRDKKTEKSISYVGDAVRKLWQSIGIACILIVVLTIKGTIFSIPVFILIYGVGVFTTGRIIQFKPLIIGGLICFVSSLISVFIPQDANQLLLLAATVMCSYIIPGHLLSAESTKAIR